MIIVRLQECSPRWQVENMTIEPIKPIEVQKKKNQLIPEIIIGCFNNLIIKKWDGTQSVIDQNEAIEFICSNSNYSRKELFENKFLDIEDLFSDSGWKVTYYKSPYWSSEQSYWIFKNKNG